MRPLSPTSSASNVLMWCIPVLPSGLIHTLTKFIFLSLREREGQAQESTKESDLPSVSLPTQRAAR